MKIGIITFHRAANYGAVLQAYALQSYLQSEQHKVDIIDYRCKVIEHVHSPIYFIYVKGALKKTKQFLRFPIRLKKRKIFNQFLNRKLELSDNVDRHNIKTFIQEKYDIIIAGSDQIWNPDLTNSDTTYLLDFASEKTNKVSYAASFGIDKLDNEIAEQYRKCICRFDKISVREQKGAMLIKNLCNRDVSVVIDPTLLISCKEWDEFLVKPKYTNYVLLYMIKYNETLATIARNLAAKNNMQLIFISDSILKKSRITYVKDATPEKWVGLFRNASYVVTNSFHGAAFSINFNQKVIIGLSHLARNGNSRIIDLLDNLAIEYNNADGIIDLSGDMEWKPVNIALDKLRENSYKFLEFSDIRKEQ